MGKGSFLSILVGYVFRLRRHFTKFVGELVSGEQDRSRGSRRSWSSPVKCFSVLLLLYMVIADMLSSAKLTCLTTLRLCWWSLTKLFTLLDCNLANDPASIALELFCIFTLILFAVSYLAVSAHTFLFKYKAWTCATTDRFRTVLIL